MMEEDDDDDADQYDFMSDDQGIFTTPGENKVDGHSEQSLH